MQEREIKELTTNIIKELQTTHEKLKYILNARYTSSSKEGQELSMMMYHIRMDILRTIK